MNKIIVLIVLGGLLLFSGCLQMKTIDDCDGLNDEDIIEQTSWGENVVSTDSSVITKAKVTCYHTAALAYAAKNDFDLAGASCEQITQVSDNPSDLDMLKREEAMCIDATAKRLREPSLCEKIDTEDLEFEKKRCIEHATPPPKVCASTFILLSAIGSFMFVSSMKNKK